MVMEPPVGAVTSAVKFNVPVAALFALSVAVMLLLDGLEAPAVQE